MSFARRPIRASVPVVLLLAHALIALTSAVNAQVPQRLNYQAYLTHADGTPVDGPVEITFGLHPTQTGTAPLWSQTITVIAEQGLFQVGLGNNLNPFPSSLWNTPVYMGLTIGGEELTPRRRFTTHAYAFQAEDANSLNGATRQQLDQQRDVDELADGLGLLTRDVDTLNANINSVDGRLASVEAVGATLTGIFPGPGLVGGGGSGAPQIGIGIGAVTNDMLGANAVGSTQIASGAVGALALANDAVNSRVIADGTVTSDDIDASERLSVVGLNIGEFGLSLASPNATTVIGDTTAIRWYDNQFDELASLVVGQQDVTLTNEKYGKQMLRSDDRSTALGGADSLQGYDVTVDRLHVWNELSVGYQREETLFSTNQFVSSCFSAGGAPCFKASQLTLCPEGSKALGGGLGGLEPDSGAGHSGPARGTEFRGWQCDAITQQPDTLRCFVICAALN